MKAHIHYMGITRVKGGMVTPPGGQELGLGAWASRNDPPIATA